MSNNYNPKLYRGSRDYLDRGPSVDKRCLKVIIVSAIIGIGFLMWAFTQAGFFQDLLLKLR